MLKLRSKISRLTVAIIILISMFFFYALLAGRKGEIPWHRRIIVNSFFPLQKSVTFVKSGIGEIWNHYFALVGASKENIKLKKELNIYKNRLLEMAEIRKENERLHLLLNFKENSRLESKILTTSVISYDPKSDFRVITVDRGMDDGLRPNMPVVGYSGLVGKVADVSDGVAHVLLITDPNSAVDVHVQRSRVRALLVGSRDSVVVKHGYFLSRLEYLKQRSDIKRGDILITSGLDGVYPEGIPVGTVKHVESNSTGIFKKATVVPFEDFSQLEEVIIKR